MASKQIESNLPSAGAERLKSDYRMYGSLLLLLGLCAAYGSFAKVVSLSGNPTVNAGLPVAMLIANVLTCIFGVICMAIGYAAVVLDKGNATLTSIACVSIQPAWLPCILAFYSLVKGTTSDVKSNMFIPLGYEPTLAHVKFVGSMSSIAIIAYAFGFIGSLGFMAFSMHAIQSGKPEDRSRAYLRGRSKVYSSMLMVAGIAQFLVGCFVLNKYGQGPLPQGPVTAGPIGMIFFPEISITVGFVQAMTGGMGVYRSLRAFANDSSSMLFQAMCFFTFLCMMSMQNLAQIAYAQGEAGAAMAPSMACVYFGLTFMPAFLDWKMNSVPESFVGYYEENDGGNNYRTKNTLTRTPSLNGSDTLEGDRDDIHDEEEVEV